MDGNWTGNEWETVKKDEWQLDGKSIDAGLEVVHKRKIYDQKESAPRELQSGRQILRAVKQKTRKGELDDCQSWEKDGDMTGKTMGAWMGKRWGRGWGKDGDVDGKKMGPWMGKRWECG